MEYYNKVIHHPAGLIVGSISTTELDSNRVDSEPDKFKKWTCIMSKEAGKHRRQNTFYDHSIDLKTDEISS
jgi:hypothetical protein